MGVINTAEVKEFSIYATKKGGKMSFLCTHESVYAFILFSQWITLFRWCDTPNSLRWVSIWLPAGWWLDLTLLSSNNLETATPVQQWSLPGVHLFYDWIYLHSFLVCMLLKRGKLQLTRTNYTLKALDFSADAERVSKHCVACHALENTAIPIVYHTHFSVRHCS